MGDMPNDPREPPDARGGEATTRSSASAIGQDPYRVLFERSADAILIIEGETFVDCNQATVDMLRYRSKEELLRTHPSELSPPAQPDGQDSYTAANAMIALAFEHGSHRFEWDHRRADGEVFPVEVLLTAVPEGERQILHVVWRDITERKRLEQQLRQTQKLEAIGRLAGGIAHDFNNLLVAIIGNAEQLADELADRLELREMAEQVLDAGQRAADLTRQLLAFSRGQVIQTQVLDLNQILRGTERLLGRLLGADLELVFRPGPGELPIKAERGQVEQVLMNLVGNARDAMPDGGLVTVESALVEHGGEGGVASGSLPPGRYAHIRVRDTGMGMTPEVSKHAFDPFFTTKPLGRGTGLGLSTVYGIATQAGGGCAIESSPGQGTTVDVWLPVVQGEPVVVAPQPDDDEEPTGGHETVLVVEDEPALASLVERVLRRAGYTVLVAADGRAALRCFDERAGAVDLVFSDVVMPGLGGPGMLRALLERGFQPRVLFASGYSADGLQPLEGLSLEVDLLSKPFTPRELLRRVRAALDRS